MASDVKPERELFEVVVEITSVGNQDGSRSHTPLVVIGDHDGRVGYASGKAKEVGEATRNGFDAARTFAARQSLGAPAASGT